MENIAFTIEFTKHPDGFDYHRSGLKMFELANFLKLVIESKGQFHSLGIYKTEINGVITHNTKLFVLAPKGSKVIDILKNEEV